jgi:hypothetical protein
MTHYRKPLAVAAAALLLAASSLVAAQAQDTKHRPFVHAYNTTGDMEAAAAAVRDSLAAAGLTVAGEYSPYDGALVLAVTSDALQKAASATDYGAYGAAQRVSLTAMGEGDKAHIQVIYTNPVYMAHAYRMNGDLTELRKALGAELGAEGDYGSEEGLTEADLAEYRYMGFPMYTERFDQHFELASYGSWAEAVGKVEEALAAGKAGASKVYRVDIPGKEQTLFGVGLTQECSGDGYIMERIDFKEMRQTAHLPYEMLVTGGDVTALAGRFRIAVNFPDLGMVGEHGFTSIMCAPDSIRKALQEAAGATPTEDATFKGSPRGD